MLGSHLAPTSGIDRGRYRCSVLYRTTAATAGRSATSLSMPAVSNSPKRMPMPEVARHRVIRNHRKALPRR